MRMTQFLSRSRIFRVALMALVFGIGFFTLGANIYIPFHYTAVMPRSPQPEAGRVYQVTAQYGTVVYVNKQELARRDFAEHVLTPVAGLGMLVFVLLALRLGWFRRHVGSHDNPR